MDGALLLILMEDSWQRDRVLCSHYIQLAHGDLGCIGDIRVAGRCVSWRCCDGLTEHAKEENGQTYWDNHMLGD